MFEGRGPRARNGPAKGAGSPATATSRQRAIGPEALKATVKAFEGAGADELIFDPISASMDQIERLAEAVLS